MKKKSNRDENSKKIATKRHYEKCVFDFDYVRRSIFDRSLLGRWIKENNLGGKAIYDIGCGAGSVGKYIIELYPKCDYLGIDISSEAIRIAKSRGLNVVVGDNLNLFLKNSISDLTISEGVIHHTPNPHKAFKELVRITKSEGVISLYVYNKKNYYYYIYNYFGRICRFLYEKRITKKIVESLIFNLFHILYVQLGNFIFFRSFKTIPRKISWNIFSDQILTPVAHFYLKEDIVRWASQNNLKILNNRKSFNGQGLQFILLKI